jgi:hypothetical protein
MTEVLFFLTIIFVAYVVYTTLGNSGIQSKSAPVSPPKPEPQEAETEPVAQAGETKPEAESESVVAEKAVNSLRDPKTGEIASVPANYRFAKRWIKDALVVEGLLDKVYKNGELDAANSAKVKRALEQLKKLEKYQA